MAFFFFRSGVHFVKRNDSACTIKEGIIILSTVRFEVDLYKSRTL